MSDFVDPNINKSQDFPMYVILISISLVFSVFFLGPMVMDYLYIANRPQVELIKILIILHVL